MRSDTVKPEASISEKESDSQLSHSRDAAEGCGRFREEPRQWGRLPTAGRRCRITTVLEAAALLSGTEWLLAELAATSSSGESNSSSSDADVDPKDSASSDSCCWCCCC